jgi:hypothetical protein
LNIDTSYWEPSIGTLISHYDGSDGIYGVVPQFRVLASTNLTCCSGITGNIDGDVEGRIDIGDLTALINYLYSPKVPEPACLPEADIDGDSEHLIDIGDLTALIAYLYISGPDPAACP